MSYCIVPENNREIVEIEDNFDLDWNIDVVDHDSDTIPAPAGYVSMQEASSAETIPVSGYEEYAWQYDRIILSQFLTPARVPTF